MCGVVREKVHFIVHLLLGIYSSESFCLYNTYYQYLLDYNREYIQLSWLLIFCEQLKVSLVQSQGGQCVSVNRHNPLSICLLK